MYKEAKLDSTIMACDFYYIKMYYMHVHASDGAHPCADSDFFFKMGSPGIICNF